MRAGLLSKREWEYRNSLLLSLIDQTFNARRATRGSLFFFFRINLLPSLVPLASIQKLIEKIDALGTVIGFVRSRVSFRGTTAFGSSNVFLA